MKDSLSKMLCKTSTSLIYFNIGIIFAVFYITLSSFVPNLFEIFEDCKFCVAKLKVLVKISI